MKQIMEKRPDIFKSAIIKAGGFDSLGRPVGWEFSAIHNGEIHPKSVGIYFSPEWTIYSGYTIEELKTIKRRIDQGIINI